MARVSRRWSRALVAALAVLVVVPSWWCPPTRCLGWVHPGNVLLRLTGRLTPLQLPTRGRVRVCAEPEESVPVLKDLGEAMNAYATAGNVEKTLNCFEELGKNIPLRTMHWNTVLKAFANAGDRDGAEEWYRTMLDANVRINSKTFGKLAEAAAKASDAKKALEWIDALEEADLNITEEERLFPYNIVLDACSRAGDAKTASRFLDGFAARRITPNEVSFSTVIQAAARAGKSQPKVKVDHVESEDGRPGLQLNKRGDAARALATFEAMKEAGLKPDERAYVAAMNAFAREGNLRVVKKLYDEMRDLDIQPTLFHLNNILDACAKAGDTRSASLWFKQIGKQGLEPNTMSYDILIDAYANAGNLDGARRVFMNMDGRVERSAGSYAGLIKCCARIGDLEEAHALFSRMQVKEKGLKPNKIIFTSMMSVYARAGRATSAMNVMAKMRGQGIEPDLVTFRTLLRSCGGANGRPDLAEAVFRDAVKHGVQTAPLLKNLAQAVGLRETFRLCDELNITRPKIPKDDAGSWKPIDQTKIKRHKKMPPQSKDAYVSLSRR